MNSKITASHTERQAILYIRQSSPQQITEHEESRRLQYAMQARLKELGFVDIEVIDEDLGRSASGRVKRSGFDRMVSTVGLGRIGAVTAREVSRFARNNQEWSRLLELCSLLDVLVIDHDSVYDLRDGNDRLLLGLKGNLSEYELTIMKDRLQSAIKAKAARGEMLGKIPVGYCTSEDERVVKNPDVRVQKSIESIFLKVLQLGSIRAVVGWMVDHDLEVPVRRPKCGKNEHEWARPSASNVSRILSTRWYCGDYAWGRTQRVTEVKDGRPQRVSRNRPSGEYEVLLPDHHEAYIDRSEFERVRAMVANNKTIAETGGTGAPGKGSALLAKLLRCCRCGRRLHVNYATAKRVARYSCPGEAGKGGSVCISFVGKTLDSLVSSEVLAMIRPSSQQAALEAVELATAQNQDAIQAIERDLEAAGYQARLAQRRYESVDPDNRLVAGELESRWNDSLAKVKRIETRLRELRAGNELSLTDVPDPKALAEDLDRLWNADDENAQIKKRVLRLLIEEIMVDLCTASTDIKAVIHWKGGVHTAHRAHRRSRGQAGIPTAVEAVDAIRSLIRVCPDSSIAIFLSRNGLKTARGKTWTVDRVRAVRSAYKIPSHSQERQEEGGWLTLTQVATKVSVTPKTVRRWIDGGSLAADHPLGFGPWIVKASDLESPTVKDLLRQAKKVARIPSSAQKSLVFSTM